MKPNVEVESVKPPVDNLQMYRFVQAAEFHCVRCNQDKKAKNIAIIDQDWEKTICNGCYGLLLSQR